MRDALKPCPFCGGDAELDTMRPYSTIGTGKPGTGVSVYCRVCPAEIMLCRGDVHDLEPEAVIELWNARHKLPEDDHDPDYE